MNHLSLFAGIEGFGLAGRWLGWQLVASVEIDKYCQQVIKQHFPQTIIHDDIYTTDFTPYRDIIDIITGGFPCQTFSLAGKGAMDMSLWLQMLRAVREAQPAWVVAENVFGLASRKRGVALEQVCANLEAEGYTVFPPFILPTSGVEDGDHERFRVWIVAYSHMFKRLQTFQQPSSYKQCRPRLGNETYLHVTNSWLNRDSNKTEYGDYDGLRKELHTIRAIGNAIDPYVFFEIGDVINTINEMIADNEHYH